MKLGLLLGLLLSVAACTQRPTCESDCDCYGPPEEECEGEWRCVVDECFYGCRPSCVATGRCEEPNEHCSPASGLCSLRTECTDGLGGSGG